MSLRTKILLSVGCIVFIAFGTSTIINIRDLKQEYIQAIEWRSDALAQGIINDVQIQQKYKPYYVMHIDELLKTLSKRCSQLYELYKADDITHFAVINEAGQVAAHNDEKLVGTPVEHSLFTAHRKLSEQTTAIAGTIYHTLIPIFGAKGIYIGAIDIGVPRKIVDEKITQVLLRASGLFGLFLTLMFFSISLLMHIIITNPIKQLAATGQQLAEGRPVQTLQLKEQRDEIAVLKAVFNSISKYLHDTAAIASRVATGVLAGEVRMRSDHDVLGKAVHEMLHYLKTVARVASKVEEGDLRETIEVRSATDAFGRVLHSMTEGLRSLITRIRSSAQQIASTGTTIASFATRNIDIVQNVRTSAEKTRSIMNEMGASVEKVAHRMDILSTSAEASYTSVKEVTSSIEHIAANTDNLTRQIHQTVVSLNGAVNSLEGVVQHTDVSQQLSQGTLQDALEGQEVVRQVMSSMETLQQTMTMAVEAITGFSQRSQDIDTVLTVIREFADQTSLLALNASIIAAQAGEHGRGFHIVAEEIKNLATGVMTSTKDIASIVHNLQQDTSNVVQTVHQGAANVEQSIERTLQAQETLHKIADSAQHSSSVVTEITKALHEAMTTSRNISTAMNQVDVMTDEITAATNKQQASMKQIHSAVEYLNDMTSEIQDTTDRQAAGVQEVFDATQNVTTLIEQNLESSQQITLVTETLASQAESLLQSVDRFKLS